MASRFWGDVLHAYAGYFSMVYVGMNHMCGHQAPAATLSKMDTPLESVVVASMNREDDDDPPFVDIRLSPLMRS